MAKRSFSLEKRHWKVALCVLVCTEQKSLCCGRFFFFFFRKRCEGARFFHVSSWIHGFLYDRFETLRNGKEWLRTSYWSHFPFNDLFHFCQDYEVSSQSPISLKTSIVFVVLANAAFVLSYLFLSLFLIPKESNHFFLHETIPEKNHQINVQEVYYGWHRVTWWVEC